jgi:hypothetical protein
MLLSDYPHDIDNKEDTEKEEDQASAVHENH